MKSLFVLAAGFAALSVLSLASRYAGRAQTSPEVAPPPLSPAATPGQVHFLESHLQLGTVRLIERVAGAFTIINDTDRTVSLFDPFKSCSCTEANVERRTLAPGERCSLTVAVQTGTRRGKRAETVSMICSDPDGSNQFQFAGRILFETKGVFEVEPTQLTLTRAEPRASFTIRADAAAEFHTVLDVKSNHRCVKVDASKLPVVTLELDPTTPDESILTVDCVVYTDNPAEDTIRVPIRVHKE